ncbi:MULTISPECIES: Imm17 family immunity protein [Bacteroidaceae]|uniref:Imm17 family immunity protein n=1 Tax=Bacteroidaceae TaxID=815 RepID=UPI00258F9F0E|nr:MULTISPECIES: Imm17 family immunity protein [Bacteroidaceae]
MGITDIYEALNRKAEEFFEWAQAHPQFALLIAAALLGLWLIGLLFRWKWACHWQFNSKLWLFDDCKPETRRRIQIILVSVALMVSLMLFYLWR